MSVICQTFVQNAWRKDLCSNCFKSKEEHGNGGRGSVGCGGGGGNQSGGKIGQRAVDESLTSRSLSRGLDSGVGIGSGSKRYMGVAGSVYQRSYYNRNSWKSIMLDKSDSALKSPGLIKGMSNLVSHENEKNLKLGDIVDSDERGDTLRSSRLVQHVKTSQSEARILSELLGNSMVDDRLKSEKKEPDKHYSEDKGDASSDLGSEASNDVSSTSSASSSCYEVTGSAANSDTTSVKSDAGSEPFEGDKDEFLSRDVKEISESQLIRKENQLRKVAVDSILKRAGDPKGTRGSITFSSKIEEVIGYGGDVDYSDGEDMFDDDDDDDDDDDFNDLTDLTPDERVLRRLTEKNTDFNSDNDNLKKDIEELLPSVKELEEKRKMIIAEIEELERLGRENRAKTEKSKLQEERKEEKPEGKVKLKRSPPLVTIKPLIARNNNEVRVNQVLPMKNGEIVRPLISGDIEEVPMRGIKPKYVSKEDEMVEKAAIDDEMKVNAGKITSIDDLCFSAGAKKEKVTSIDDVCVPVINSSIKSGEIDQNVASAITRIDNLLEQESQVHSSSQIAESNEGKAKQLGNSDIKTLPALSVTPSDHAKTGKLVTHSEDSSNVICGNDQNLMEDIVQKQSGSEVEALSDTKEILQKVPVSAPRKSLLTNSKEKKHKDLEKEKQKKLVSDNLEMLKSNEVSAKKVSKKAKETEKSFSPQVPSKVQGRVDDQKDSGMLNATNDSDLPNQVGSVINKVVNSDAEQNPVQYSNPPDTEIPMASKILPLNHDVLEIQTYKEPRRISVSASDDKTYTSQSEPEINQIPENTKTPASRQESTSSLFSTFGTPVVLTSIAQNSFLHSSSHSVYNDDGSSSPIYSPATTDFLKEIKSHPEVPTPTAGIQKSALYASTSCLKGLPGAKPVITPKPPILKDKPKVPFKPAASTSRIYATPSTPVNGKLPLSNLSGAMSTPNLTGSTEDKSDTASDTSSSFHSDPISDSVYNIPCNQKKPPPTTQAPAIPSPNGAQEKEVVYDIPVTIASSQSCNSESFSSKSSPNNATKVDDATIYHEIDDSIKDKRVPETSTENQDRIIMDNAVPSGTSSAASVERVESTRCQPRSTFEANRSLLSAALDFGTKALRSSASKRTAPQPPAGELEENSSEELAQETFAELESASETEHHQDNNSVYEDHGNRSQNHEVPVPVDNNDGESYSSFTDDFDDDEEEEEEETKVSLRKAERSSSAIPFYRNSMGPVLTYDLPNAPSVDPSGDEVTRDVSQEGWDYGNVGSIASKPLASRSHSVPRVTEHMVITDPSPSSSSAFSSKFGFGRSGFFRPSSPPTLKRDLSKGSSGSDRGRDRTKKSSSSRFSLKKLLRLGSKDEDKKSQKEHEKKILRETKKGKLQIIHPLDYNQNGVEVIARPEKTSPIYDYTGIYGYIPPPRISSKIEDPHCAVSSAAQVPAVQPSPAPSLGSKRSEMSTIESAPLQHLSSQQAELTSTTPAYAISSSLPTVSVRSSCASPISSVQSVSPATSTSINSNPVTTSSVLSSSSSPLTAAGGIYASVPMTYSSPAVCSMSTLEKRSSFLRKETNLERCESGASQCSSIANSQISSTPHHLGYNSEGRPKPPPPPRKVSLESAHANEIYSSVADLTTPKRPHSDSTNTDLPSRPQRPPPPTRSPSNAGSKSGPPRPEPPKLLGRDSVYANLGDVRAPITPRKPGRSASIRGEEDREKRRAPQPPHVPQSTQEASLQTSQRTIRHQHQDSTSSSCSSISSTRASKGPAPPRPLLPPNSNDYETYERDSTGSTNITQIAVGSTTSTVMTTSRIEDYQVPQNNSQTVDSASTPSLRQEKTGRLSVRRGSAVTHRSLEDQYGAVISANLEALSNMLDQLSNNCCPPGYEDVSHRVQHWSDIDMDDDIVVGAGHRLFYAGMACGREITLMLTPETKVDAHHLLTPMPITTFKDQIPTHLLSHKTIIRGKTTLGLVWILPFLNLTTLRTLADESLPNLTKAPHEWERHTCLLLLQYVTGLKQLQAQGVEETCIDLTLAARGCNVNGQDPNPRVMLVPPVETGIPVMSLCECAVAAALMLMGVDDPLGRAKDGSYSVPATVPSQRAFKCLLQLLHQEKAGSLTQVKCVLEVLLFGPDNSQDDGKTPFEIEAALQRWLDLERATVLHTLIRGPLESSVLTKYHLLFLVRTNSRVLRETMKLFENKEEGQ